MVQAQPALRVRRIDPALAPERVDALAAELALPVADLAEGGAVIFQQGTRRRAVDLLDVAGFDIDDLGAGTLARFRAEEAFATAIAELVDSDRPVVCHTTGHGELPLGDPDDVAGDASGGMAGVEGAEGVVHWRPLAERITREGARLEAVSDLEAGVPEHCRVLVVAGPTRPLSSREAQAVDGYLTRGGRLLLALSTAIEPTGATARMPATGLELVLAPYGIQMPQAVVVDPAAAVAGPTQWLTATGYGDHPIVSSFAGRRFTLWLTPRAVLAAEVEPDAEPNGEPDGSDGSPGAEPDTEPDGRGQQATRPAGGTAGVRTAVLVQSSAQGWAETDLGSVLLGEPVRADADLAGPVPVAAAAEAMTTGARVVVFGSAVSLSSVVADRGANELLAAAALAWLSGRTQSLDIGAKTPEQLRLIMTQSQMQQVFVLCVLVLPGALTLLGGLLWWRRRRG